MINRIESFSPCHLEKLQVQAEQRQEDLLGGLQNSVLFSLFDGEEVMAVIGFVCLSPKRRMAVSLLSQNCGRDMLPIVRIMRRCYEIYKTERVEMTVKTDFKPAHRLAKLLGFEREGTLKKFLNGQDYDIYARCL